MVSEDSFVKCSVLSDGYWTCSRDRILCVHLSLAGAHIEGTVTGLSIDPFLFVLWGFG